MATYTNQLVVLANGKTVRIGAADNIIIGGNFTAANLFGNGAGITDLAAANITGTLDKARLPATTVYTDASAALTFSVGITASSFSGSGAGLTSLPASQVTGAGALPDSVLSSNIPRKNQDVTFSENVTVEVLQPAGTPDNVLTGADLST